MTTDATKPSLAALWSVATTGMAHEEEPEEVPTDKPAQKPKIDNRSRPRTAAVANRVNSESDAKLVAQMREREQAHQRKLAEYRQAQALLRKVQQAQQAQQAPMPQPNPALVQRVVQARQTAQHQPRPPQAPRPRPQRFGVEKLAVMMTTGTGICRSWKASRKQKKR